MRQLATYLCVILLFAGCSKDNALDCFRSNGDEAGEMRDCGSFNTVQIHDKINLKLVNGPEFKVEVRCGANIIHNISTVVNSGTLSITNKNTCNFVRGYKRNVNVIIMAPYLKKVENLGVGTVTFDENYKQDTLLLLAESSGDIYINGTYNEIRTTSHGNGDIYLNGSSNRLYVYTNGINFFRGENMVIHDFIFVETLSIGDCHVNATQAKRLDYHIWESGNIYYTGNPPIITDVSDGTQTGRLIKED